MLFDIFCCVFRKSLSLLIAPHPILVTLEGIVILVKLLQFSNASLPILVTLFGIVLFDLRLFVLRGFINKNSRGESFGCFVEFDTLNDYSKRGLSVMRFSARAATKPCYLW